MHFPFENVLVVWRFAPKDRVRWMLQNTANEMTQNRSRWRAETVGDGTPTLSGCRDPLDLGTMGNHRGRRRRLRPREPLTSPRAVGEPPRHRPAPPSRRITAFLPRLPNGGTGQRNHVFFTPCSPKGRGSRASGAGRGPAADVDAGPVRGAQGPETPQRHLRSSARRPGARVRALGWAPTGPGRALWWRAFKGMRPF